MAEITEIPTSKLISDLIAALKDLQVTRNAYEYGFLTYSGGSKLTKDRVNGNIDQFNTIIGELSRRSFFEKISD